METNGCLAACEIIHAHAVKIQALSNQTEDDGWCESDAFIAFLIVHPATISILKSI